MRISKVKRTCIVFFLSVGLGLFLSSAAFCGGPGTDNTGAHAGYNVVIISVNALRADHLGCYGYSRATSPHIDAFARESIIFDRAIAQSYWTLPSLVSLFTSKYISAHNVDSRDTKLGTKDKTLASVLKIYGYATAGFTCGLDTASAYGLHKGFDVYNVYNGNNVVGSFADVVPRAVKWLNENKDKKFFLFLQSYDAHPPYSQRVKARFSQGYKGVLQKYRLGYNALKNINGNLLISRGSRIELSAQDLEYITSRYDDCIEYLDGYIGKFLAVLEELRLSSNTIVVFCADHGEELGERGTFNRFGNQNLYQEVLRVPLIIRYPALKEKGRRESALAESVDIMPTILELLAIPSGHELQGKSLAPLVNSSVDTPVHTYVFSEASKNKWMILSANGWKLLYSPEKIELYNLNDDPRESCNVIEENAGLQVSLMKEFFFWREHHKEDKADNYLKLDPELIEKLRSAGYW
jgi:arylsulfatase A-like enzyme